MRKFDALGYFPLPKDNGWGEADVQVRIVVMSAAELPVYDKSIFILRDTLYGFHADSQEARRNENRFWSRITKYSRHYGFEKQHADMFAKAIFAEIDKTMAEQGIRAYPVGIPDAEPVLNTGLPLVGTPLTDKEREECEKHEEQMANRAIVLYWFIGSGAGLPSGKDKFWYEFKEVVE